MSALQAISIVYQFVPAKLQRLRENAARVRLASFTRKWGYKTTLIPHTRPKRTIGPPMWFMGRG